MSKLAERWECTGCTACASVCPKQCIKMKEDENGFLYPFLIYPEKCINCSKCEKVCPVLEKQKGKKEVPIAYAAFSKNEKIRRESSSGGIFSEVANVVISQGGIVYGAAYDDQFDVCHICVDTADDLWKLRGAKYAESNLGDSFLDILERLKIGQKVLFSGTPCQVAGLKSFLGMEYDNLFCIDFVCHGIPSPMVWKSYVEYRAKKDASGELPKRINLRSKHTGWSRYHYSNVYQYEDGTEYSELSSESLYMKLFVGDYISRVSCENCKFKGYSRVSDITLGDFWGIWDIDPDMDDDKGTSVILVQSEKGYWLWNTISDKVESKKVSLEEASRQNQSMIQSAKSNPKRKNVLERIKKRRCMEDAEDLIIYPKKSLGSYIKFKIISLFMNRGK